MSGMYLYQGHGDLLRPEERGWMTRVRGTCKILYRPYNDKSDIFTLVWMVARWLYTIAMGQSTDVLLLGIL